MNNEYPQNYRTQLIVYIGIGAICTVNMVGFVIFGTDVDNYEDLVKVMLSSYAQYRFRNTGARTGVVGAARRYVATVR